MRQFFRITLRVLILAAVFLASAMTAMRFAIHGREVAVPKLEGMSSADAERASLNSGLLVDVDGRYYSVNVPAGRVLSQLPQPGEKVRRGTHVRVAVSMGAQKLVIPDVVGESQRAAEINIGRRGLELGTVAVAHISGYPPDQVVAQSPPANSEGVASPKVNLLVTAPPDPNDNLYITPDFVGHTLEEASKAIAESPMRFGKVTTVKNTAKNGATKPATAMQPAPVANGKPTQIAKVSPVIIRQNPAAGQKIPAGSQINFEVVR